tara:strand:- start:892 stop:1278 length:387 start_codon:yes stop_codon:yes gene_type:complete
MYNVSKIEIIKQQLFDLQSEILSLVSEGKQVPELIEKTNLLRENELLKKITEKKSLLIDFYLSYTEILEELLSKSNTAKLKTVRNKKKQKTVRNKKKQKTRLSSKRKSIKKVNSKRHSTKHKKKRKAH